MKDKPEINLFLCLLTTLCIIGAGTTCYWIFLLVRWVAFNL